MALVRLPLWRMDKLDAAVVGALLRSASASEGLAFLDGLGRFFAPQTRDSVLFALVFLAPLRWRALSAHCRRVARATGSTDSLKSSRRPRPVSLWRRRAGSRAVRQRRGEGRKPERAGVFPDPVLSNL